MKDVELVDWTVINRAGQEDEEHEQQAACDEDQRRETENATCDHIVSACKDWLQFGVRLRAAMMRRSDGTVAMCPETSWSAR